VNKTFFITWGVVFVGWMAGSFVIHGMILHADYAALTNLFRAEADAQKYFPLLLLAHVLLAGGFTWIYSRGIEAKPWVEQGLRFGAAVAVMTSVPTYTIYFVVQPTPMALAVKQILLDSLLVVLLGILAAFCYRSAVPAAGGTEAA